MVLPPLLGGATFPFLLDAPSPHSGGTAFTISFFWVVLLPRSAAPVSFSFGLVLLSALLLCCVLSPFRWCCFSLLSSSFWLSSDRPDHGPQTTRTAWTAHATQESRWGAEIPRSPSETCGNQMNSFSGPHLSQHLQGGVRCTSEKEFSDQLCVGMLPLNVASYLC